MRSHKRPKCATLKPGIGGNWSDSATSSTGGCTKSGRPLSVRALDAIGEGLEATPAYGRRRRKALVRIYSASSGLPRNSELGGAAHKSRRLSTPIVVRGGRSCQ